MVQPHLKGAAGPEREGPLEAQHGLRGEEPQQPQHQLVLVDRVEVQDGELLPRPRASLQGPQVDLVRQEAHRPSFRARNLGHDSGSEEGSYPLLGSTLPGRAVTRLRGGLSEYTTTTLVCPYNSV